MESKDDVNWYVPSCNKLTIKQIHMCEFVENNWDVETCMVYINCMKSYNQVLTRKSNKFVCLGTTPIVTNDDINWYVVTCIVED